MEKYLKIKNKQKDIILNTRYEKEKIDLNKTQVFKTNNKGDIFIGENKFNLEDLLLNGIPLTDEVVNSVIFELNLLINKMEFINKSKQDFINEIKREITRIDDLTKNIIEYKNTKVEDVLSAVRNNFKNIVPYTPIYLDNLIFDKNITFFNGERTILKNYKVNTLSSNYKVEIEISPIYLSYITFENVLNTIDSFKITFSNGNTITKYVEEFLLKEKIINVENKVSKIIIEGVGAEIIAKTITICVGKSTTNRNRGYAILELSPNALSSSFYIEADKSIKIFAWDKKDIEFNLSYNDFKIKYYDFYKSIETNERTNKEILNKVLVCFIETNESILNKIKIYGVD